MSVDVNVEPLRIHAPISKGDDIDVTPLAAVMSTAGNSRHP